MVLMTIRMRSIFLLWILLWQSLSMLNPLAAIDPADRIEHRTTHWDNAFHAAEQATVQPGDTPIPVQHSHVDDGLNIVGLFSVLRMHANADLAAHPRADVKLFLPTIYLEGPLRPPKQST